jgi:hypothetical protein
MNKSSTRTVNRLPALTAAITVIAVAAPPRASAGTYIVKACGNGPNVAWQPTASPGWVAEQDCNYAGNGNLSVGLPDPSVDVPAGNSASYQLSAPPGASVAWVEPTFRIAYASRYGAELGLFRSDQPGRVWGCDNFDPNAFCGSWLTGTSPHIDTPGAGAVRIQAGCIYSPSCPAGGDIKLFTREVKAAIYDSTAPSVSIQGGGLASGGWVGGVQGLTWSADDNVGIQTWRHWIDGQRVDNDGLRDCGDFNLVCPNLDLGQHLAYNTSSLPDGPHTVTAEAVDRAGNPASAAATFYSDNHAPASPQDLAVDGGEGWRSKPGFRVTWTNPADGYSGLLRAVYQLCRARTGECVSGASPDPTNGRPATSAVIGVPRQGDWTLQLYLQDNAGNADPNSARTQHLRYDSDPPSSAVFDNVDPNDPRHVGVAVDDAGSGLGGGEIDLRAAGSNEWTALQTTVQGDDLVASIATSGCNLSAAHSRTPTSCWMSATG